MSRLTRSRADGNWFVGFPVDGGRWFEPLMATAPTSLRRFHPDDLHVTVAFLGAVGEARAQAAFATLGATSPAPVLATLAGVEPFGGARRPSALSVTFGRGGDALARLVGDLRGPMFAAAGAEPDAREPRPHLTVARPSRKAGPAELRDALAWAVSVAPLDVEVRLDRLALYGWSEDRAARLFRVVTERRLG